MRFFLVSCASLLFLNRHQNACPTATASTSSIALRRSARWFGRSIFSYLGDARTPGWGGATDSWRRGEATQDATAGTGWYGEDAVSPFPTSLVFSFDFSVGLRRRIFFRFAGREGGGAGESEDEAPYTEYATLSRSLQFSISPFLKYDLDELRCCLSYCWIICLDRGALWLPYHENWFRELCRSNCFTCVRKSDYWSSHRISSSIVIVESCYTLVLDNGEPMVGIHLVLGSWCLDLGVWQSCIRKRCWLLQNKPSKLGNNMRIKWMQGSEIG